MTSWGRKNSGILQAVSTVFIVFTTTTLEIPQAHSALPPMMLNLMASATESSMDDGRESLGEFNKDWRLYTSSKPLRIVVVVSNKNPLESLKRDELRRIFLRKKTQWKSGSSITVYERSVDHEIRQEFSKRIFEQKPSELKEYWMNLQLTRGLKPPKVLRSAKLVKRYLQRVRGGISYLYLKELDDTVKVIEIKGRERG